MAQVWARGIITGVGSIFTGVGENNQRYEGVWGTGVEIRDYRCQESVITGVRRCGGEIRVIEVCGEKGDYRCRAAVEMRDYTCGKSLFIGVYRCGGK